LIFIPGSCGLLKLPVTRSLCSNVFLLLHTDYWVAGREKAVVDMKVPPRIVYLAGRLFIKRITAAQRSGPPLIVFVSAGLFGNDQCRRPYPETYQIN
jgi:hypothetical protein